MAFQLVLDPDLGVGAGRFAAAWNERPACRQQATAQVAADAAKGYDPLGAELVLLIAVPLLVNLASNALYDLIKEALLGAGVRRRTRIVSERRPDGSELIVVTVEEEG